MAYRGLVAYVICAFLCIFLYARTAGGYGGVIVQSIDGEPLTALYGHTRILDNIKEGSTVTAGQQIAVLGKGFSPETDGEREHLHFAIHKGTNTYLLGHEPTTAKLNQEWENPTALLQNRDAIVPGQDMVANAMPSETTQPGSIASQPVSTSLSFLGRILSWFTNLFSFN